MAGCTPSVLNAPRPASSGEETSQASPKRVELDLDDGHLTVGGTPWRTVAARADMGLRGWVDQAVEAITTYYGHFPVGRARLLIEPVSGSGVQWARTYSHSGFFIRAGVGTATSASQLASDWMLTHEFVHLSLPTLADEHDWFQEGAATYVEPIARAQAGLLPPERVWAAFVRQMPKGLPASGDRGLDFTTGWARTYWGGALFCLVADVEIRKQTDNRYGLREALRGILDAGGTLDHRWTIREALSSGDRAVGVDTLTHMYERWRSAPVQVDLEALWRDLGIQRDGRSVRFDDTASLADIRQAITAREGLDGDGLTLATLSTQYVPPGIDP